MSSNEALTARYALALKEWLVSSDEEGLERAYNLGREAIGGGMGVIQLTSIHARALDFATVATADESKRAWQFLAEALAPFEMALRGFREANEGLKHAAEHLERRVLERTSELRAAESSIREQTQLLHSVVESMSDGLAVSDRSGKLLLLNGAGRRLLGPEALECPPAEWGRRCGIFQQDTTTPFAPDDVPLLRAMRGLGTSTAMYVKNAGVPEGAHVSVTGSELRDESGQLSGGIALLRDVTESRQAHEALLRTEEQLRQSQKMDAIGRLAGGVAHDFNNILSVIISLAQVSQDGLKQGDRLQEDLLEIEKAGIRAAALTKQLLLFSRQKIVETTIVDVDEILGNMNNMLQRLIGTDVELLTLRSPGLGRVRADAGGVEQVVMNLVVNARDAMPKGGRITIETADVVVDEAFASQHAGMKVGPHVMLAVTDTGVGMDKATQRRVFEPFFTTKEAGKGTGLGLSTVFGIVRQSGGAVWLYSELGRGTTFKVYFPHAEGAAAGSIPVVEPQNLRGSETILLVEDDEQVRGVAAGILRRHGYGVIEARNAGEALLYSESQRGPIQLLLTDVVMPQMSGPDLARRLTRSRPNMKVICMSGYTDDSVLRQGALDANVSYLQKPLTPDSLATKVRSVLDSTS